MWDQRETFSVCSSHGALSCKEGGWGGASQTRYYLKVTVRLLNSCGPIKHKHSWQNTDSKGNDLWPWLDAHILMKQGKENKERGGNLQFNWRHLNTPPSHICIFSPVQPACFQRCQAHVKNKSAALQKEESRPRSYLQEERKAISHFL